MADHAAHMVTARLVQAPGAPKQWILLCVTCQERIQVLPLCGVLTTKGAPCRNVVRVDLGHTRCTKHRVQTELERE
jgi:hypothetical protein